MLDTRGYDWQAGQPLHIDKASMWEPGRLLRGPALRSHRPHAEGLGRAEHDSWDRDRTQKAVIFCSIHSCCGIDTANIRLHHYPICSYVQIVTSQDIQ